MSSTPKRYRLLKDLPYVKAGAIYKLDSPEGTYVCDSSTAEFNEGTAWDGLGVNAVENAAPGWFELITETPTEEFKWTDELVKDWGSYIRLREPNFEINEELHKWKQSKSNKSHIPKDFSLEEREVKTNLSTQPVEEAKDWEIVEFRGNFLGHSAISFTRGKHGGYETGLNWSVYNQPEARLIKETNIFSVRRLSDNLLIEVGKEYSYLDKPYKILSLEYVKAKKNGMFGRPVSEAIMAIMAKINQNERVNILSLEPPPTPPKERIEVEILQEYGSTMKHYVSDKGFYHPYQLRCYQKEIPKEKFPAIKAAIEKAINQ